MNLFTLTTLAVTIADYFLANTYVEETNPFDWLISDCGSYPDVSNYA